MLCFTLGQSGFAAPRRNARRYPSTQEIQRRQEEQRRRQEHDQSVASYIPTVIDELQGFLRQTETIYQTPPSSNDSHGNDQLNQALRVWNNQNLRLDSNTLRTEACMVVLGQWLARVINGVEVIDRPASEQPNPSPDTSIPVFRGSPVITQTASPPLSEDQKRARVQQILTLAQFITSDFLQADLTPLMRERSAIVRSMADYGSSAALRSQDITISILGSLPAILLSWHYYNEFKAALSQDQHTLDMFLINLYDHWWFFGDQYRDVHYTVELSTRAFFENLAYSTGTYGMVGLIVAALAQRYIRPTINRAATPVARRLSERVIGRSLWLALAEGVSQEAQQLGISADHEGLSNLLDRLRDRNLAVAEHLACEFSLTNVSRMTTRTRANPFSEPLHQSTNESESVNTVNATNRDQQNQGR